MSNGILQEWVANLGLRHQGVLMSAIRGCDSAPKNDPSKNFVRVYRSVVLRAHCGESAKAKTFIEAVSDDELMDRFETLRKNLDHYPHHYIAHLMHAIEIVGYKHPDSKERVLWSYFYQKLVKGLHLQPESEALLDERLNADEVTFAARD